MKKAMYVGGMLLVFIGIVWILQGFGVLPGSFMTGQMKWAVIGGCALVAGAVLMARARR